MVSKKKNINDQNKKDDTDEENRKGGQASYGQEPEIIGEGMEIEETIIIPEDDLTHDNRSDIK